MNAPTHDHSSFESPLDAERVEWVPASPDTVEVRVVGRWRAAPPTAAPTLLVEVLGERRRFPAVEHGMTGAVWRATYVVPIELRPRLEGRLALAVGAAEIGLPAAIPGPADEGSAPPPATVVDRTVLAERRARRAELAEESLVRRTQAAEATAATLRTQLEHLEARVREAVTERDRLARDLRSAEQREEAERRVRLEVAEERGDAEHEVRELRDRLRAAHERAAELTAELEAAQRAGDEAGQAADAARRAAERALAEAQAREADAVERLSELDAAEARLRAAGGALAEEADGARAGLGAVTPEAEQLAALLETERTQRVEVEQALAGERDRLAEAQATVALLQGELDRRAEVQATVHEELARLRAGLESVRAQAGAQAGAGLGDPAAEAALRARIEDLEVSERATREELESARGELERRGRELVRARDELERLSADAAAGRTSEQALREAERATVAVRREAAEAHVRLEQERRRRFEIEASLRAQIEREREQFGAQLATAEGTLRAQLAEQRRAFEDQVRGVERLVGDLRERLALAAGELETRLQEERDGREAAERRALELGAELERFAGERQDRAALAEQLATVRAQLDAVRRATEDRTAREAAVQRLVAELLETAARVRRGFEEELRELQDELTGQIDAEREGFRRQLAVVEERVAELRAELDRERAARRIAEQDAARARDGREAPAVPLGVEAAPVRPTAPVEPVRAVAGEGVALAQPRSPEELRAEADAMIRNLEDAGARLRAQREALEGDAAPDEAYTDAEAETEAEAGVQSAPVADPATSARPAPAEPAPSARSADAPPSPAPSGWMPTVPRPSVATPAAESRAVSPAATPGTEAAAAPSAPATEDAPPIESPAFLPPAGTELLRPRVVGADERRDVAWLRDALRRLAETDAPAAGRLLRQLLAARPAGIDTPLAYALAVEGLGTFRVALAPDATAASLSDDPAAIAGADLRLEGTVAALAPLAAGGAGRRLKGIAVHGSRRRARALLRSRRASVDLADLVQRGVAMDPEVVLRALAEAVDPAWTSGRRFAIAFHLAGPGAAARHTLDVRDGAPIAFDPAESVDAPGTVVEVDRTALVPLLARLAPPPGGRALVHGDARAHALFMEWTDRVQGIGRAGR